MSNKPHVLFFVDYYHPHRGGVETVFSNIISRLLKKNYTISLITSRYTKDLPQKEVNKNLIIYRVGKGRVSYMRKAYSIGKKILAEDPSIALLHGSSYSGIRPVVLLAKKFKKPSLLTVHEVFGKLWYRWKGWRGYFYHLFEKSLFWIKADLYHCVSYYTFNSLRLLYGVHDDHLCVIHNGVDESWKQQAQQIDSGEASSENYTILYYGHAGYSKGVDYWIQSLLEVRKRIPHAHFVFNIIDSKRTKSIIKKIKTIGLQDAITIHQGMEIDKLQELIQASDLVVAPSLAEGFGSVVSEVSSLGKPLVTTYAGAIPEASRGEVVYVHPSSSSALISAVQDIYTRKKPQQKITAKSYSRDSTVEQLEEYYRKLSSRVGEK